MNAQELLHDLRTLGVDLTTDGEELKLSAPTGTLTPERVSAIKRAKPVLIQLLLPPSDRHGLTPHCAVLGGGTSTPRSAKVWHCQVDGHRITVIDPHRSSLVAMRWSLGVKFGSHRVDEVTEGGRHG